MSTFVAVGVSSSVFVAPNHGPVAAISNTFVADVWLERQLSAGMWKPIYLINATRTVRLPNQPGTYRLNCTAYTSGTVTYTLTSAPENVLSLVGPDGVTRLQVDADGAVTENAATINASSPAPVAGTLINLSAEDALTAHAGGTKAAALVMDATKSFHRFSTVATNADSSLLPPTVVGAMHVVVNGGVASMQVFGAGTDTINDVATATGVAQAAGITALYVCPSAGKWCRILSA